LVVALQQVEELAETDDMRCADVPPRGSRQLVDQEQRLGEVAGVDDVPELVPHLVRAPCIRERSRMKRSCQDRSAQLLMRRSVMHGTNLSVSR